MLTLRKQRVFGTLIGARGREGVTAPDLWLCAHAGGARRGGCMVFEVRWSPIQPYGGLS
jgi:hypothetical protein